MPSSLHERFVGRADDLWRIHDTLTTRRGESQSAAALTGALEGGAGVGKSRLALEYLYRFGSRHYPGGLFWIDAERTLEPQYYEIARALNPTIPDWKTVQSEPGGASNRLVSEFRALAPEKPALVIVDNVPEPQPGEPPKPFYEWFPAVGDVRLLVTSRTRVSLGVGGAVLPLPVDVLDEGAAQALLTRGIDFHAIDAAGWREITEWVGRLPLALELLNRALAAQAFTAGEVLSRARSAETTAVLDEAMDALRAIVPAGSLRGASEALVISYERLPDRAKPAARLIAWMAPSAIPEALLEALGDSFNPAVRAMLVARSFVIETPRATVPMFGSMHRVLADFLRTKVEDRTSELTHLTRALLSVMSEQRIGTPSEWPLMEACEPHATILLNHVATQQPRIEFVDHTAMLALALTYLFLEQGFAAKAAQLGLKALLACVVETESERPGVPAGRPAVRRFMRTLTWAIARSGESDQAIELQRIDLSFLQKEREAEDPEVLSESDNLALLLRARGRAEDLDEAHQILERTAEAWRRRDPASLDTLTALNNLGLVIQERGDTTRAVVLFEEVLEGLRHLENAEMKTIQTLKSLAHALSETNPERACALLEEALAVADRIQLPDRHRVKLDLLEDLGGAAQTRGDYVRAQTLLRRAVEALSAEQGDRDLETTAHAWALFDAELCTGHSRGSGNSQAVSGLATRNS